MSALLEKPVSKGSQTLRRTERAPRGTGKPRVEPRIHLRATIVTRKKPDVARIVLTKCGVFVGVLLATFTVSSFTGQVLLEGARQQRIEAKGRAHDARLAETALTARLDDVTSQTGVETWALANGFVAIEAQKPSRTEGLVARR
jgi:hypothetical protein